VCITTIEAEHIKGIREIWLNKKFAWVIDSPPTKKKIGKKYFSGNYYVKFGHFSGNIHVKFGNFANFFRANHKNPGVLIIFRARIELNSGILIIFHTYFSGKMSCPPKVDWAPTPMDRGSEMWIVKKMKLPTTLRQSPSTAYQTPAWALLHSISTNNNQDTWDKVRMRFCPCTRAHFERKFWQFRIEPLCNLIILLNKPYFGLFFNVC